MFTAKLLCHLLELIFKLFILTTTCILFNNTIKHLIMKKSILFSLLISGFVCFSQNTNSNVLPIFVASKNSFLSNISLKPFAFNINLLQKNYFAANKTLSIYNPTTQINDNYTIISNSYYLSTTKTFSLTNSFNQVKTDSFNPSGATKFNDALLFGTMNLLFGKF